MLLKNRENLAEDQEPRLEKLLNLNKNLNVVYMLKDDLKRLWDCEDRAEAIHFMEKWIQTAEQSGIDALQNFAKTLSNYSYGLLKFHFPNGARVQAFGFGFKPSEDWQLHCNTSLVLIPGGRRGFVGIVFEAEYPTEFVLSSSERVQGGLTVDNISYIPADVQ